MHHIDPLVQVHLFDLVYHLNREDLRLHDHLFDPVHLLAHSFRLVPSTYENQFLFGKFSRGKMRFWSIILRQHKKSKLYVKLTIHPKNATFIIITWILSYICHKYSCASGKYKISVVAHSNIIFYLILTITIICRENIYFIRIKKVIFAANITKKIMFPRNILIWNDENFYLLEV